MHGRRLVALAILTGSLLLFLGVPSAHAIPAFARKYQTSCQTCHVGFPKLTPFGEAFRLLGYRLPSESEDQIKIKPVSLGADAYKKMWPKAIWPSDLPGQVPLALNVTMASVYASSLGDTGTTVIHNDFQFPAEANLFAGGTLGEHMGFLGELTFAENPDGSSSTDLERVHLQAGSFFGPEHMFNFKIGKFAPDLEDGFHEMWLITGTGVDTLFTFDPIGLNGGTGVSDAPNGISLPRNVKGVEMYGIGAHRFFYTVGAVNGLTPPTQSSTKDLYARADYKIGGMALDGDTTGVKLPPENWRERSLRVGILGYHGSGKGAQFPFTDENGAKFGVEDRSFNRGGVFASWYFDDLNVFGVALTGHDNLHAFDAAGADVNSGSHKFNAWFVQADYVFLPPLQGSLRYESATPPSEANVPSVRTLEAALSYFFYANVKGQLEYRRDLRESKNYTVNTFLRFAF